jgi:hypothetical protein
LVGEVGGIGPREPQRDPQVVFAVPVTAATSYDGRDGSGVNGDRDWAGCTGRRPAGEFRVNLEPAWLALEVERVVPTSGNLSLGGQQVWLGPALAGRTVTIWVDETSLHVVLDGARLKTLPSRLGVVELARLAADGAKPAGPPPLPGPTGTALEIDRMVNAAGLASLAGVQVTVGSELAGQRVTLRMDGTQMAVIGHDGTSLRTLPCPVPTGQRHRLRGARRAATVVSAVCGPVIVQRRVSQRGQIMVATQRIHVGLIHAGKIVTVTADEHSFGLAIDGIAVASVPRTANSEIHRYKAYATRHATTGRRRDA